MILRFKREQEKRRERERREERSKGNNFHGKSNDNHGREMKTGEGGAKSGKEKMVLVFFFPLFLIFPFQIKNKRKNNEHVKEPIFFFPLGNKEKNRGDRARGGICCSVGRVYGQGANPAHFPHPLEKKGTWPPFPSCSSFLAFLSFKGEQEKRREREGERRDKRIALLMGRAKKRIEVR